VYRGTVSRVFKRARSSRTQSTKVKEEGAESFEI
jgi:hypothetical protein